MPAAVLAREVRPVSWKATILQRHCTQHPDTREVHCDHEKIKLDLVNPENLRAEHYFLNLFYSLHQKDMLNAPNRRKIAKAHPLLLVMPLPSSFTGNLITDKFCRDMVNQQKIFCGIVGGPSVWSFDPQKPLDTIEKFKQQTAGAVSAVQISMDYLQTRPGLRPGDVGLLGTSVAGIVASLVAEKDLRVKSVVLLASAAGLTEMILQTQDPWVQKFRQALIQEKAFTDQTSLRRFLDEEFRKIEPLYGVSQLRGTPVLMLNLSNDLTMPRSAMEHYKKELENHGALVTFKELYFNGHDPRHTWPWQWPATLGLMRSARSNSIEHLKATLRGHNQAEIR